MHVVHSSKYDFITQDTDLVAYLRVINEDRVSVRFVSSIERDEWAMGILFKDRENMDDFYQQLAAFQSKIIHVPDYVEYLAEVQNVRNEFKKAKQLYGRVVV